MSDGPWPAWPRWVLLAALVGSVLGGLALRPPSRWQTSPDAEEGEDEPPAQPAQPSGVE